MLEAVKSGGMLMIPILFCGIAALFIILERLCYFLIVRRRDRRLFTALKPALAAGDDALCAELCAEAGTPLARALETAFTYSHSPESCRRAAVDVAISSAAAAFGRFLPALATISHAATLLGLLGTVTGNIRAFQIFSSGAAGGPASFAGAVAEALVTTAAGLSVSIPSLIFGNAFAAAADRRISQLEAAVSDVLIQRAALD